MHSHLLQQQSVIHTTDNTAVNVAVAGIYYGYWFSRWRA